MNGKPKRWPEYVCQCDTSVFKSRIAAIRDSVDFIIVSVHGGNEYEDGPSRRMSVFARTMLHGGADLVLGHHPHIAYGIESSDDGVIVHSLGNFIFLQPQYDWTQYSYAFTAKIIRDSSAVALHDIRLLPVRCGFQPRFIKKEKKIAALFNRVDSLSVNFKHKP